MEYSYSFNEQDFEFYKLVTLDNLQNKVKIVKYFHLFLIILFIVISFFGFYRLGFNTFISRFITLTLAISFMIFITSGKRLLLKRYRHLSYTEKANQNMFIKINEEIIYLKDFEEYEYFLELNKVNKIIKTYDYLVILTKKSNMIIPLRVFTNETELNEFTNLILSSSKYNLQIIEKEYK